MGGAAAGAAGASIASAPAMGVPRRSYLTSRATGDESRHPRGVPPSAAAPGRSSAPNAPPPAITSSETFPELGRGARTRAGGEYSTAERSANARSRHQLERDERGGGGGGGGGGRKPNGGRQAPGTTRGVEGARAFASNAPEARPSAASDSTSGDLPGYVFMCSNGTRDECLSKKLFGLPHGKLRSSCSTARRAAAAAAAAAETAAARRTGFRRSSPRACTGSATTSGARRGRRRTIRWSGSWTRSARSRGGDSVGVRGRRRRRIKVELKTEHWITRPGRERTRHATSDPPHAPRVSHARARRARCRTSR